MTKLFSISLNVILALFLLVPAFANDWTEWRGPARDGISPEKGLPTSWSPAGQNLAWKAPYGGRSAPIVMNGRVYLQNIAGKGDEEQERIMCFNADTGKLLWEHRFNIYLSDVPPHRVGWASPVGDPATGNVYAFGVGGTLLALDNQADPSTGTVKIKAIFPNEEETLYPNQFVNARLLAQTRKDVLIIPSAALQRSPQRATFVYVVKTEAPKGDAGKNEGGVEGTVEIREVTPGASEGDQTIVEKGLEAGEMVVTEGVDKLVKGARVTVPSRPSSAREKP